MIQLARHHHYIEAGGGEAADEGFAGAGADADNQDCAGVGHDQVANAMPLPVPASER